jgi:hypothetical protein
MGNKHNVKIQTKRKKGFFDLGVYKKIMVIDAEIQLLRLWTELDLFKTV